MMWLNILTLLLVSLLIGDAALAQVVPDPQAVAVDSLFKRYTESKSPGLAVAIVRDGKVILSKGYGLADIEHGVRITPATVFDAASVAKQFTGFAVAVLVAEGKIKLTDDIRKYIPELQNLGQPITISQLLHHTSGLRDWTSTLAVSGWTAGDVITSKQILMMASHQRTLNFVPGAEHLYSNTGYNLLAEVVHQVTKRTLREWTIERIFRPLKMTSTRFRDDHTEVIVNRAFGYHLDDNGRYRNTLNNLAAPGSSSLFTTADDLARWIINFDEASVGGRATISQMLTRGSLNDGTAIAYAFGIGHGSYRGLPMFGHSGRWASLGSHVMYYPQQKFGVVVLTNNGSIDAQDAALKIVNIYLEKELASPEPWPYAALAAGPVAVVPPTVLDEYVGLYRLKPGKYVRIKRSGERLTTQVTGEFSMLMSPRSEREFWVPNYGLPMVFHREAGGKVTHLELPGERAQRVDESASNSPLPLSHYVGEYESEELGTFYCVAINRGSLELQHRRLEPITLTLLHGEDFGATHWFMRSVEFKRDAGGRVIGLVINGEPGSRDIRFAKRQ